MRRLAVLVVVAVVCAACGVGPESGPHPIDPKDVPFGLLAPRATTTTTNGPVGVRIVIYLQGTQRLVPVPRQVTPPATVDVALHELVVGATSAESNRGLSSPVSAAGPYQVRDVHDGTASVEVSSAFTQLAGQNQIVATAQLVFTLTGLPGVTGVALLVGDQPAQVPAGDGSLTQGPLTRSDYAGLAPL